MLNKNVAAFLAIFLGVFGTHQFYIGRWWAGVIQGAFFIFAIFAAVTGAPEEMLVPMFLIATIIPFLTGILWFVMPSQRWHERYDKLVGEDALPAYGTAISPGDSGDLKAEGIRYYRSADYDLAVEAFTEAVGVDYGDPGSHFNLACSFAQLGRYPEALQHLELSVTFGLPKPERIEKHPALGAMRKLPAFAQFRANNYRRQAYITDNGQEDAETRVPEKEEAIETIQDFATPPPRKQETPLSGKMDIDLLEQISRLRELHDAGVLTPREYQLQKERLLG